VGYNYEGTITTSYSTGTVSGNDDAGGLVGYNYGSIATGFWDIETSGLLGSDGGVGLTTAEMMDPEIIGLNGLANDPNWVLDPGNDYPRLAWEGTTGQPIPQPVIDWMDGEGTLQMPYQISSIDQLILLSKASALFDKHFILVNDLDLEGIPRSQAVLPYFSGSFDGNGFSIRNLYIRGGNSLGLIGIMREGSVMNLSLENISIEGTGGYIGGLVGENEEGSIVDCHSNGEVRGGSCVGGLVGINGGGIIASSSSGTVRSISGSIGGLVGCNSRRILAGNKGGSIVASNSTCAVSGKSYVGGLVGSNRGNIVACHSTGAIDGDSTVGGFAGSNGWVGGSITSSYSTGIVTGNETIGGFVGDNEGSIISSFWNVETSGQSASAAGTGLHTAEMYDINTYLNAGWDFVDEIHRGTCDYWQMSPDDYPRLHHPVMPEGLGTIEQPYMIRDEYDLGSIWLDPTANYRLEASVDLSGITWSMALIPWCAGNFDGNDHIISNLLVKGGGHLGLFGQLGPRAEIFNLGLEAVDVNGVNRYIGGLVGDNNGNIATSYSTGKVSGYEDVGGLVGRNLSSITMSHSSSTVTGDSDVGGLVGENRGSITTSYSIGTFSGDFSIGGIVGHNIGNITASYSTGTVSGEWEVGGLVGTNGFQFCNENGCSGGIEGAISSCYSVGSVTGGGLVGSNDSGRIACSFWDVETSGQIRSNSGVGKTTAEMQTAATFLEVGWDFVDESVNGTDETWWIHEGQDYPRLWWELNSEN